MIYSKIFILCSVESMTMDALSTSSSYISNLPQINPIFKTSLPSSQSSCWSCNPLIPNLRISDGSSHGGIRIQALSHNDDTSSEGDAESSGLGLFPGDIFSLSQISLALPQGAGNSGGNRAGLFRTPISGGVQNATSAHALPPPALAVCNLLEQSCLRCTIAGKVTHLALWWILHLIVWDIQYFYFHRWPSTQEISWLNLDAVSLFRYLDGVACRMQE
ncbi:hypothetical protein Bca52824_020501 [Brassica carinata]|uniref:Uncharacterized protein n=1 Tax=Brassica carinata TaxID=52824 RepID=A0A8X8AYI3_BRACI|nr:hypothetical protein Bca52824_020501 [Brassica carinata]